jgi:hypothetical protein
MSHKERMGEQTMKKFIDQKYSAYKKLMSNVRVILYLKE